MHNACLRVFSDLAICRAGPALKCSLGACVTSCHSNHLEPTPRLCGIRITLRMEVVIHSVSGVHHVEGIHTTHVHVLPSLSSGT